MAQASHSVEATDQPFEDAVVGQAVRQDYQITDGVYRHFLDAFDDRNPLHVEDAFARHRGFESKVMHGTILNGFVSHFIGMCFPGRRSLLHSVAMEYKSPCYLGDMLTLEANVTQKVEALRIILLTIVIRNVTQSRTAAKAKVQVGFTG